jgi:predicted nucleic acid-binding protein
MKVLVDTNIFIASMRFAGLKRKLIWKLLEKDVIVVVTDFILEELRENFEEQYSAEEAQAALENLLHFLGTGKI